MRRFFKPALTSLCLGLILLSPAAFAADKTKAQTWYRYYDAKGLPTLSDQISETHIRRGYQILNGQMQVIRQIPAFDEVAYQNDKSKRDAAFKQQQEDARILRLYSSAYDAELARNRKTDALETSIGYNSIQLMRLKRFREDNVEMAAEMERSGKAVPAKITSQIALYDQQIAAVQALIAGERSEIDKVRATYAPIIARLTELESSTKVASNGAAGKLAMP